ncbi:hypothetical protein IV203_013016 [Nitzschia inconspicua]|uniref:Uncharacterized protein n=1 Tax=Nitzschia inconspicua TaxID=303405 RepID=A0A9K3M809_9STRA|nr:hypothetical protein IV203_013016 [Nitzschia inconspicua]
MAENLKQDFIQRIAKRAKLDDNGATPCPESKWEEWATPIATLYLLARPGTPETLSENDVTNCSNAVLQCNASEYQKNVVENQTLSNQYRSIIPAVCPLSASQMGRTSNASQQLKYFKHTLDTDTIHYGAFVSVQSYTQFCTGMNSQNFEFQPRSLQILEETIHDLFPRESCKNNPSEKPRGVQLCRFLQSELGAFGNNTDDTTYAECIHHFPVVPQEKGSEQDADIAIVVRRNDKDNGAVSSVAAVLEYKPTMDFSGFCMQASVYGTDTMNISNLPCVVIQVCGWSLDTLEIRCYGVVASQYHEGPTHALSLLLDSKKIDGLKLLISGLKGYLEAFVQEQPNAWHHGYFSNVVSKHPLNGVEHVYKAYDYRLRTQVRLQDQRQPNIDIVKKYVDANAIQVTPQEHFHIVCTKFFSRDDGGPWYGPVPAFKFANIIRQLKQLHEEDGMVHGDVRLRNMILHEGIITDFDWTRSGGSMYPSTLLDITGDGKRHEEVSQAIKMQRCFEHDHLGNERSFLRSFPGAKRIEKLELKFDHDIFSMRYVLNLFVPINPENEVQWKDLLIASSENLWSVIAPLSSMKYEIKLKDEHIMDPHHSPDGVGTGSPFALLWHDLGVW